MHCRKYAQEEAAQVFITDVLLTTLMCTPRSVYSWDIVITRAGGRLFFDKRDGSSLDALTVAETSPEQIAEDKDNINGVQQLSAEATTINQNFSQQVRMLHLGLLSGKSRSQYMRHEPFGALCMLGRKGGNPCYVCFLTSPLQATHIWVPIWLVVRADRVG